VRRLRSALGHAGTGNNEENEIYWTKAVDKRDRKLTLQLRCSDDGRVWRLLLAKKLSEQNHEGFELIPSDFGFV